MKEIKTLEVDKWEKIEGSSFYEHVGMMAPMEAFNMLRNHLTEMGLVPDEYFIASKYMWGDMKELPDYHKAECTVNWGGNEGIYLDISLVYAENGEEKRMRFATGKTLGRSGDDFLKMSRIAGECSMMLNGRGETVRFEEEPGRDLAKEFKDKTRECFHNIGHMDADTIEREMSVYIEEKLKEYDQNLEVAGIAIYGSRSRGLEEAGSDLDIVVEYKGDDWKEDSVFNLLHQDALKIGNVEVDINPINSKESGTLGSYLVKAEEYLSLKKEMKIREMENLIKDVEKLNNNTPDGKIIDADTILVDRLNDADNELSGFAQDIFDIYIDSKDKDAVCRMFYEFTGMEFKEYLEKCKNEITRETDLNKKIESAKEKQSDNAGKDDKNRDMKKIKNWEGVEK